MGACYSCKSTEPHTHSTAPMASDNKSGKRTTPYSRSNSLAVSNANHTLGSAASHGFGFKKKNPVTIQSSDRTNNLVQKYEKISLKNEPKGNSSLKNSSNIVAPTATSIPRIGYRSNQLSRTQPPNKNSKISCNTSNYIEKINNNAPSHATTVNMNKNSSTLSNPPQVVDNQANISHLKKSELLKKQFLGSDFSINKSQTSDAPCKSLPSQKVIPQHKVTYRSGSQNSLNEKSNANRNSYSGPTSNAKFGTNGSKIQYNSQQSLNSNSKLENQSKIPHSKITTQYSGLPRPSSARNENTKAINESYITISYKAPSKFMSVNQNSKPKLQRSSEMMPVKSDESLQDEVAMQTSVDTLPDENLMDSDMKFSSGKLPSDADSGLGSSMKSSFDTELRNGDTGTLAEVDQIDPLSQKSTTPSTVSSPGGVSIASDTVDGQALRKQRAEPDIDSLQEEVENIELVEHPAKPRETHAKLDKNALGADATAGQAVFKETISPSEKSMQLNPILKISGISNISSLMEAKTLDEKNESIKQNSEPKSMRDSFSSCKSSDRTGTFSPTSDIESRSDFLIDDEIADQPSLMVLNDPKKANLLTQSCIESSKLLNEEHETITKDDSFTSEHLCKPPSNVRRSLSFKSTDKKSPSHPTTLAVLANHRQSLCSTLSSCSSINSDDLMMDFDIDRCNDFDGEDTVAKTPKGRLSRLNSTNSTLDELNHLVDAQKETSLVRQRLASIRNRSRTTSSPDITQSLNEMPRHRSHSTPLKPPRPIRILSENETTQGAVKLDPSSYRSLCQDVTNVKTMLFRLKRLLHDADTLNPFETNNWRNSVYQRVASFEAPHGLTTCQEDDGEQAARAENLVQENADLRRQIVFLEQQNAEKDRTIKLLQQQMTKYSNTVQKDDKVEQCNAATQTMKMKSTTSMDGISPTTVSNSNGRSAKVCQHNPNIVNGVLDTNLTNSLTHGKAPSRSASASNILHAPSESNINNHSSDKKTSVGDVVDCSSSEQDLQKQSSRFRSGAFSNVKRSSYSNNALIPTKTSESRLSQSQPDHLQNVKSSSSKSDPTTGLSRNSFARNSGRFLSLFKLKKNSSSNA